MTPHAPVAPEPETDDVPAARMLGVRLELSPPEKPYGTPREALRGLSFTAPAGLVTVLVGSNGAGKTTALRALTGAMPVRAGTIQVLGCDLGCADAALPPGVAVVPDAPAYPDHWDAHDVAKLLRRAVPGFDVSAFGTELRAHRVPLRRTLARLSRGEATQLGVAAALASTPRLLVLDEPLARLDPVARRELVERLRARVADGVSVLLSTHDLEGMDRFADRLVVIDAGRSVFEGDVESAVEEHLVVTGSETELAGLLEVIGPEHVGTQVRGLIHVDDAAGLPSGCDLDRPTLADVVTAYLRDAGPDRPDHEPRRQA